MRFWILFILIFAGVIGYVWFQFGAQDADPVREEVAPSQEMANAVPKISTEPIEESKPIEAPKPVLKTIKHIVPFTSQAPTGDWSQSAFQDGCEEASTLMVWMAREGKKLTRDEVRKKLIDMAEFQEKKIGHGVDTDGVTTDTILLQEYFGITDSELIAYDFTLTELKLALKRGLVIVPTNGRLLKNPNFTAPGPLQHMLVITGYDVETKEFITNDPGTRKGEGYRYPEQVLYDAIREYPTGKHLPIKTERKAMIVVPFAPQP